jgi:hypothetical protein
MAESSSKAGPLLVFLLIAAAAIPAAMAWTGALGLAVARGAPVLPAALVAFMALVLPATGLAGSLDDRRAGFGAGLFFWGVVALVSMPMFFPGERATAMSSGWAWLTGEDAPEEPSPWAERVDGMLPGPGESVESLAVITALDTGEAPLPVATSGGRSTGSGSVELESDEVVLPYRPDDSSLVIPVDLEGPDGTILSTHMTYDTGATLTTVDRATLHSLGIAIPQSNPIIELRTASGVRSARLVLLDRVWLGGFEIPGVTVSVCDECRSDNSVGLLGLNATGRFRVVVDQRAEALVLRPRSDQPDQLDDIEPWIQLSGRVQRRSNGTMIVELDVQNLSRRDVDRAIVHVRCGKSWPVEVDGIRARSEASARVELDGLPDCDSYELELARAWW